MEKPWKLVEIIGGNPLTKQRSNVRKIRRKEVSNNMSAFRVGLAITLCIIIEAHGRGLVQSVTRQSLEDWVASNYSTIIDSLFPMRDTGFAGMQRDIRWRMTARITNGLSDSVTSWSLSVRYNEEIEFTLASSDGESLLEELKKIKREHEDYGINQVAAAVRVNRRNIFSKECPELKTVAKNYESIRMSPELPQELIMDASVYDLMYESQYGNTLRVKYYGPGSRVKIQTNPLISWAEDVRGIVIEGCGKRQGFR
jgi:hypothetical protein